MAESPLSSYMKDIRDEESLKYEEVAEIGRGAYGTVFKGRNLQEEGQFVAMKKFVIPLALQEGVTMTVLREIATLKQIDGFRHPNIVRLLDVIPGGQTPSEMRIWLIFELIDQDLANFLQSSPPLEFRQIQDITHQILSGIDFLHSERVIHRDLKPQNILVTSRGEVKIADFGLSRIYSIGMKLTTEVVTLWYRAPEVLLRCQYATAVDMWSCGTIFAELYTKKALFEASSEIQLLHKIFEVVGLPRECEWPRDSTIPWKSWSNLPQQPIRPLSCLLPGISPLALDFLQKLVAFDYSKRMSAREALCHPFFKQEENANTPEFRISNQQEKQTTHYLTNKQLKSTSTIQSTATSFISR